MSPPPTSTPSYSNVIIPPLSVAETEAQKLQKEDEEADGDNAVEDLDKLSLLERVWPTHFFFIC